MIKNCIVGVRQIQLLVVVGLIACMVRTASAQVTFSWPDTEPDVATYQTPEDCLGMLKTYENRARAALPRRLDTLPSVLRDTVNSLPQLVHDAAVRCGQKFSSDRIFSKTTLEFNEKENAYRLMLLSGNRAEARSFSDQWLAAIPESDDTMHAVVLSKLVQFAIGVPPMWFDEAFRFVEQIPMGKFWATRMSLTNRILWGGVRIRDTAPSNAAARWLITTPGIVGDSIVRSDAWQNPRYGLGKLVYGAQQYLHKAALLDSLRSGTKAYTDYLKRLRDSSGLQWAINPTMSHPISAEYWFPQKPQDELPRKGAVSVVLTIGESTCGGCLGKITMIKRLKAQFPSVEFTFLTRTRGWHGLVIEPPTPDQEAFLIDSIWRRVHQLPATVAVHNTQYWRLPEPDRRRINEGGPNEELYPTLPINGSDRMYLIDRAGELIFFTSWSNGVEERVSELLEALVNQRQ